MSNFLRRVYAAFVFLLVASCSGGGCSSCAGGAITPIRGGFPLTPERRIPRAMQVRLTDQGLRSIESIAPDLFAGFLRDGIPIPESRADCGLLGTLTVCPGGGCRVRVELAAPPTRAMELSFVPVDQIKVRVRLVLRSEGPRHIDLRGCGANGHIEVDTTRGSRPYVGLETHVAIRRDTHNERRHYFRADLVSPTGSGDALRETPGEEIETDDISHSGGLFSWLINLFRSQLINQLRSQFGRALRPVQEALAHPSMPDPPGCPTGTRADGRYCRYSDDSLVPRLLGSDGTGDFGRLVGRITPGLRAPNSYVIAAGDPDHGAEVSAAGMTVNVLGAVVSGQHNPCVPRLSPPPTPSIPEWTNLRQNSVPGSTVTPHLGIGVAEEFLNSALWNLWDSGLFCLGVTTRVSQQFATGILTALPALASLRNVTFPQRTAAAALIFRPQQPPRVTIGRGTQVDTDPLMRVEFPRLAVDFYAWSEERYVRFMTVTTDLTIPVNLTQEATGLRPVVGMARTANTSVTNTQLLYNAMPAQLAAVLDSLLGTAIGMFAGRLPTFALPSVPVPGTDGMPVGSIEIQVPMGGIQGLSEGTSRYVALFANLQYRRAGAMMSTAELDATAAIDPPVFDPHVYDFGPDFRVENLPRVRLRMGVANDFGHEVEYSYRVDEMGWSAWTRDSVVEVQSPSFIAQGRHVIEVRARVAGQPSTADREPARVEFIIDTVPPTARIDRRGDELWVSAHDEVSDSDHIEYRFEFDGRDEGTWLRTPHVRIPDGARRYTVRVRDESGNETTLTGVLDALTIRGGPSTDESTGCGCSTPGARRTGIEALWALALTAIATRWLQRRRTVRCTVTTASTFRRSGPSARSLLFWTLVVLFFSALGCTCGGPAMPDGGTDTGPNCTGGARYCAAMNRCIPPAMCTCMPGFAPNGMPRFDESTCSFDTSQAVCDCQELPPLDPGMVGSHLDMAVHSDGSIWFSAYSAGDPFAQRPYGDLIVGQYNPTTMQVRWQHVDGVPSDAQPEAGPSGWRGGIVSPGPDVGRWNSIALTASGQPRVAYWDTTADKLKFAAFDGSRWRIHVVDTAGRNGRYASLVLFADGTPAIAYRATVPDPMMPGRILARVRFARANRPDPQSAMDWTITDVASAPTACRASDCPTGQVCVRTTGLCATSAGNCPTACPTGQACVNGRCEETIGTGWIEDFPPGIGLFCSLALDAMQRPQLVWYDRDRGNLMGARVTSGNTWSAPFVIDGESMMRDGGDRGAWATLAVANDGTWHVAYVDGHEERLLYVMVRDGTVVGSPEVVDDGSGLGTMQFEDGRHLVGDSASIDVDSTGTVRIVYQDSTAGTLRLATRGSMGWTLRAIDTMGHTGYWARIERGQVATFFRDLSVRGGRFGVRVQSVR